MKKGLTKITSLTGLAIIVTVGVGSANAAVTVTEEFSSTSNSFTTIDNVSDSDLATGITVERGPDYGDARWYDDLLTDGEHNGEVPREEDDALNGYYNTASNGTYTWRAKIDLGAAQTITAVNTYSYGVNADRELQLFSLYGSATEATGGAEWDESDTTVWSHIADVDTGTASQADYGGTSIAGIDASYRELMWVISPVSEAGGVIREHTVFQEMDVIPEPARMTLVVAAGVAMLLFRRRMQS